jgi:hypothetical protein
MQPVSLPSSVITFALYSATTREVNPVGNCTPFSSAGNNGPIVANPLSKKGFAAPCSPIGLDEPPQAVRYRALATPPAVRKKLRRKRRRESPLRSTSSISGCIFLCSIYGCAGDIIRKIDIATGRVTSDDHQLSF